jgi:aspartate/methionine/tyrosine aminotransferase
MDVPPYVRRLYLDSTAEDLSLRFAPQWSPDKQLRVDQDLDASVRRLLSISSVQEIRTRPTFSGSIALDRALAATQVIARSRGRKKLTVVTTTPCIDIMKLFLAERADVRPVFVASRKGGQLGSLNVSRVLEALSEARKRADREHLAILLCSPENPTGSVWSSQDLLEIAKECRAANATLIVDHCFVLAGIHQPNDIAPIWNVDVDGLSWIGVWDTGKTFGLNEDKLGFIVSGDEETNAAIDSALSVVQFGVARRAKIFFAELFRLSAYYDHVRELSALCKTNRDALQTLVNGRFHLLPASAGSLALLDISSFSDSDEIVRQKLLAHGVGTIAGNIFFHTEWKPTQFVRVALARRADYFREAVEKIMTVLQ